MNCKKCGQEVDKKAVVCPGCGCKISKSIFKKWWFWILLVVAAVVIGSAGDGSEETKDINKAADSKAGEEIVYEAVDLQVMFDELEGNAMKAENTYKDKYVEFDCKIQNFDSDGAYISVEPVNADEWNFTTAMCYIKNDAQRELLVEKNVGDVVKIKGKIKDIGEIMGYSIDIAEVN